jgi:hypothetical protein
LKELPVVVVDLPETREGGEPVTSGCHGWAACLDLNMLGQCPLLKEAMPPLAFLTDDPFLSPLRQPPDFSFLRALSR